jgi:hypothetical protein
VITLLRPDEIGLVSIRKNRSLDVFGVLYMVCKHGEKKYFIIKF